MKPMSGHEIIKEHKYLLDKMKKDRIFSLCFEIINSIWMNNVTIIFLMNSQKKNALNYRKCLMKLQMQYLNRELQTGHPPGCLF